MSRQCKTARTIWKCSSGSVFCGPALSPSPQSSRPPAGAQYLLHVKDAFRHWHKCFWPVVDQSQPARLELVHNEGGGRSSNVEADLFLLEESNGDYRLFLCEVKDRSNDSWYAAVESLRQFQLLISSPESLGIFSYRMQYLSLPVVIHVTALVVAPIQFYAPPRKIEYREANLGTAGAIQLCIRRRCSACCAGFMRDSRIGRLLRDVDGSLNFHFCGLYLWGSSRTMIVRHWTN